MAFSYIYEPQQFFSGWFDGKTLPSWWDHDITSENGVIVPFDMLEPSFFSDPDDFFQPKPITVEVTAGFFDDADLFFMPAAVRPLDQPDKLLKNEVIRVR